MRTEQAFSNDPEPHRPAQPLKKRWITGLRRAENISQNRINSAIALTYKETLSKAKQLLKEHDKVAFEKDFRYDNRDDAFLMHAYISNSFYFVLECELCYDYSVKYAFNNCPVESTIRELLKVYPISQRAVEVNLQPDFNSFYQNTLSYQDSKHIYSL